MSKSEDFLKNLEPGTVVLISQKTWIHDVIRDGQKPVTPNGKRSRWAHVFLIGKPREDGQVRIYESDIYVKKLRIINGAQEMTTKKYSDDKKNLYIHAMDFHLSDQEVDTIIAKAQQKVESEEPYPIVELVGTLWAFLTRTFLRRNPLDLKKSSYCSAFVNDCFESVERIVPTSVADPTNVSPEHIFQSQVRTPERKELVL